MSLSASAEPSGAELRKVVKEILGIELVSLTQSREEAFAQEMLHFASQKYDSTETKRWNVMVERILDPGDWIDLYDVAQFTGQDACEWVTCDAWSSAWDQPTPKASCIRPAPLKEEH